jgi:hypothetical protein
MNKEFVTYEQALALKELGFDEKSLAYWFNETPLNPEGQCLVYYQKPYDNTKITNGVIREYSWAPLYQQVFRWFREKHGLYIHFVPEFYMTGINFNWQILWYLPKEKWTEYVVSNGTMLFGDNGEYPTQEDAENACLDKLIEIIKNE